MINLYLPKGNFAEKKFVAEHYTSNIQGVKITISSHEKEYYSFKNSNFEIRFDDIFLNSRTYSHEKFASQIIKPSKIQFDEIDTHIIIGKNHLISEKKVIHFKFDVFGQMFWLLTRYEELEYPKIDPYERFLAKQSEIPQELIQVPLVDNNIAFINNILNKKFHSNITLKGEYKLTLTHDIDHPTISLNIPQPDFFKSLAGDLLKRKSIALVINKLIGRYINPESDPAYKATKWLAETNNNKLDQLFFFIAKSNQGKIDTFNDFRQQITRKLIKELNQNNVGLHPSILSSTDKQIFIEELNEFRFLLGNCRYSRQHYLRFNTHAFYPFFNSLGIEKEFSMGYSDLVGFRSGTCRSYQGFNIKKRCKYDFWIHPLIIMDTTLFKYMALKDEQIVEIHDRFSRICKAYKGNLVILWHNTELLTSRRKELYKKIIKAAQ